MLQFACARCGQVLHVKAELAGKQCRCPKCQSILSVPAKVAATPPAATKPAAKAIPQTEPPTISAHTQDPPSQTPTVPPKGSVGGSTDNSQSFPPTLPPVGSKDKVFKDKNMTTLYTCQCGLQWSIPDGQKGLQCSCGRPINLAPQEEDFHQGSPNPSQDAPEVSPWSEATGDTFTGDAFKRNRIKRPKPGMNTATN